MFTLDTNILVSAQRSTAPHHAESRRLLDKLAGDLTPFALFWPCLYGFFRIVTHHRIFSPPTPPGEAFEDIQALLSLPNAHVLCETERHAEILGRILRESGAAGNLVPDAHIVALALEHGVDEILTFDGDFARFPQVRSRHPFQK